MTRLYHQFLEFLAERSSRGGRTRTPIIDNTVRDAQGNPYGSPEYNMQPKPRIVRTNEQRERSSFSLRVEENRNEMSLEQKEQREKMLDKHNENVRTTVEKVGGKNLTHTKTVGLHSVHNRIAHSIIYHHDGEEHIETDLDTGHTRTTRKGNTLKQKEENHRQEVERVAGNVRSRANADAADQTGSPRNSSHDITTEHERKGNIMTTTIRARDKRTGKVNHRFTKTVTHDLRNPTHSRVI